ncbi:hypothetical protein FKM82_021485 [Ascaphus truei]
MYPATLSLSSSLLPFFSPSRLCSPIFSNSPLYIFLITILLSFSTPLLQITSLCSSPSFFLIPYFSLQYLSKFHHLPFFLTPYCITTSNIFLSWSPSTIFIFSLLSPLSLALYLSIPSCLPLYLYAFSL